MSLQVSPDGRWLWNGAQWVPNPQPAPRPVTPYESASFRAMFVIIFLAVNALALLLGLIFDVAYIATNGDLKSAGDTAVIAIGLVALGFLLLYYGSLIPGIVLFCMWVHRIVRNLPAVGATDPRWTPGGAVGRCFIPFLNFVHPYLSVADAWRATDPSTLRAEQPIRNRRPIPALLVAWWLTWIIGRLVATISNPMVGSNDPSTVVAGSYVDLFANITIAIAAGLAILTVRRLTTRQDHKQQLIATGQLV